MYLVDKSKVHEFIENEFFQKYEYLKWLMLKIDNYDETNDWILYFKAIKVYKIFIINI